MNVCVHCLRTLTACAGPDGDPCLARQAERGTNPMIAMWRAGADAYAAAADRTGPIAQPAAPSPVLAEDDAARKVRS